MVEEKRCERPEHRALRQGRWHDLYREFLRPPTILVGALFVTLFMGVLTILGPLGTLDTMLPFRRLLYFGSSAVVMFPHCYGMAAAVLYLNRFASLSATALAMSVATLVQSLACTAAVHTADTIFRPDQKTPDLGTIFITVLAVLTICTLFVHYIAFQRVSIANSSEAGTRSPELADDRSAPEAARADGPEDAARVSREGHDEPPKTGRPTGQTQDAEQESHPDPERFYRRLSSTVSRDIVYLTVDDHYVEVHTTNGSCITLMRFADAVAHLGDLGLRTHRSYWIALRHLVRLEMVDGRTVAHLSSGTWVPVSRRYEPALRDALRQSNGDEPRASPSDDGFR